MAQVQHAEQPAPALFPAHSCLYGRKSRRPSHRRLHEYTSAIARTFHSSPEPEGQLTRAFLEERGSPFRVLLLSALESPSVSLVPIFDVCAPTVLALLTGGSLSSVPSFDNRALLRFCVPASFNLCDPAPFIAIDCKGERVTVMDMSVTEEETEGGSRRRVVWCSIASSSSRVSC